MPPVPMFQRLSFDPDTTRAMGAALADVCCALAVDRRDLASRRIARKIVELARGGAHDRARLCRETLTHFGFNGRGDDGRAPA